MRVIATEAFNGQCAGWGMKAMSRLDAALKKSPESFANAIASLPGVQQAVKRSGDPVKFLRWLADDLEWCVLFNRFGRNVFIMPPEMIWAFARTEVSRPVLEAGFRLPYPMFWIETPNDKEGHAIRVTGYGRNGQPSCEPDSLRIYSSHMINAATPLYDRVGHQISVGSFFDACQIEVEPEKWNVMRMVANKCLWLSAPESSLTTTRPSETSDRDLGRLGKKLAAASSDARRERVFSRITRLSTASVHMPAGFSDGEHVDRAEHWVRGHWRLQWYGSDEDRYQKPKWIRPHRRCVGNGEIADERVYTA